MKMRKGNAYLITLVTIVATGAAVVIGCRMLAPQAGAEVVQKAKTDMELIFTSAQKTFIHKTGGRMARSIEELGPGFGVESHGTIIYKRIWDARYSAQAKVPYWYAVLPVTGLDSDVKNQRTTCIVAVPSHEGNPVLVLVAGPIERDPQDFYKKWPVWEVTDENVREVLLSRIGDGCAVGLNEVKHD